MPPWLATVPAAETLTPPATPPTCGDGDDVTKYTGGTVAQMGTGGHAIGTLGTYDAGAADEAWSRALSFLRKHVS